MAETTPIGVSGSINLGALRKKRFAINDDPNTILELNTSDFSILTRISEAYPKLNKFGVDFTNVTSGIDVQEIDEAGMATVSERLKEVDKGMRDLIDYIFDSNVSEICAPFGSMYDLIKGEFRYEHIINALLPLYEENIGKEMKRVQARTKTHTSKYTK